jgi:hypothetical protein
MCMGMSSGSCWGDFRCLPRRTTTTPTIAPNASASGYGGACKSFGSAVALSMYALWMKCGASRDTISRIEGGDTIPGVHVLARENK